MKAEGRSVRLRSKTGRSPLSIVSSGKRGIFNRSAHEQTALLTFLHSTRLCILRVWSSGSPGIRVYRSRRLLREAAVGSLYRERMYTRCMCTSVCTP